MFSMAVSVGTRLNAWKMKPRRSRRNSGELLLAGGGDVDVADGDRAGGQAIEAGHAVHEGRLARAGGPMMAVNWPAAKSMSTLSRARTWVSPVP